jgi:hypothetical protein
MTVALWHGGQEVAYHRRCYRRRQQILELELSMAIFIDPLSDNNFDPRGANKLAVKFLF